MGCYEFVYNFFAENQIHFANLFKNMSTNLITKTVKNADTSISLLHLQEMYKI